MIKECRRFLSWVFCGGGWEGDTPVHKVDIIILFFTSLPIIFIGLCASPHPHFIYVFPLISISHAFLLHHPPPPQAAMWVNWMGICLLSVLAKYIVLLKDHCNLLSIMLYLSISFLVTLYYVLKFICNCHV